MDGHYPGRIVDYVEVSFKSKGLAPVPPRLTEAPQYQNTKVGGHFYIFQTIPWLKAPHTEVAIDHFSDFKPLTGSIIRSYLLSKRQPKITSTYRFAPRQAPHKQIVFQ